MDIHGALAQPTRRRFMVALSGSLAAGAVLAAVPTRTGFAAEAKSLEEAIRNAVGDAEIGNGDGLIALDLPQIAENGNTVPLGVSVESPMTSDDHVKSVHIFADGNPRPDVVAFNFTPASGRAQATTRMRLAKTQKIVAVARMADGRVLMSKAEVKVTIGGCGG